MTTENTSQEEAAANQEEAAKTTLSGDELAKELDKVRKEAAKWRNKVREHEEIEKKVQEEEARKRGEFEALYTKEAEAKKALEAQLAKVWDVQQQELEALTKSWTDDDKALIPDYPTVTEKLTYARKLSARLNQVTPPTPGTTGNTGTRANKFGGYSSNEEWSNKDPEGFLANFKNTFGKS